MPRLRAHYTRAWCLSQSIARNMVDLSFSKPDEIVKLLSGRLRKERLVQQLTQVELAHRAGIAPNTVSSFEAGRSVSFESVIRLAMVFGRVAELEALFMPRLENLNDILQYENAVARRRVKRRIKDA